MRGFTLIELMVVMAVIAILVIVTIPNYTNFNNNQKLADAANQLQAILRQAQNNAQTGTLCNDGNKADYWYVGLYKGTVSYSFASSCNSQPMQWTYLPSGVTVTDLRLKEGANDLTPCSPSVSAEVRFSNISSQVELVDLATPIGCPDSPNKRLEIILSLPDSSFRTIVVEKGGGIYVQQ